MYLCAEPFMLLYSIPLIEGVRRILDSAPPFPAYFPRVNQGGLSPAPKSYCIFTVEFTLCPSESTTMISNVAVQPVKPVNLTVKTA